MHCAEFEQRIHELLDERLSPRADDLVRAHADQCATCAKLLHDYGVLLKSVDGMIVPALSEGFTARVVSQVMSETSETSAPMLRRSAPRRAGRLALAAVLFLATLPVLKWIASLPPRSIQLDEQFAAQSNPAAMSKGSSGPLAQQRSVAALRERLSSVLDAVAATDGPVTVPLTRNDSRKTKLSVEIAPSVEPLAVTAGRSVVAIMRVMPPSIAMADRAGADQ